MFGVLNIFRSSKDHICLQEGHSYLDCPACIREENAGRCLDGSSYYNGKVLACRCKGNGRKNYCTACEKRAKAEDKEHAQKVANDTAFAKRVDLDGFQKQALRLGWKESRGCFKGKNDYLCGICPKCLRIMANAFRAIIVNSNGSLKTISAVNLSEVRGDSFGSGSILDIHNPNCFSGVYETGQWFLEPEAAKKQAKINKGIKASELEIEANKLHLDAQKLLNEEPLYPASRKKSSPDESPVIAQKATQDAQTKTATPAAICKHYSKWGGCNAYLMPPDCRGGKPGHCKKYKA